jgi:8-oxo-dGTP pyrophosphatase MutT (NUDIX family)
MKDRHAARAIVLHEDKLLFMERWHQGSHYFSIPDGSIEPGETPEKAAEREVLEETSCQVKALREIYKVKLPDSSLHRIYLCEYVSGEPTLHQNLQRHANPLKTTGLSRSG